LKSKFPIPVFDELMDELARARWFTSLDLNAGYHQVRLKPGEEFKTAFQTHFGHLEFRVMAFGLCGAPAIFQGAMNTTLAPLLRKCVIVFFDDILIYSASYEEHIQHIHVVLSLLLKDKWCVNSLSVLLPNLISIIWATSYQLRVLPLTLPKSVL
jgi:hypothetical protein